MAIFDQSFNIVMSQEGGYQDHPADYGNYNSLNQLVGTKWGISAPAYESYYQTVPTTAHIKALTQSDAWNWSFNTIWSPYSIYEIESQHIANQIFDILYNHSPYTAAKIIRSGILNTGDPTGMVQDYGDLLGIQDRKSINAIVKLGKEVKLNNSIVEARNDYFIQHVQSDPGQKTFLPGWLIRTNSFRLSSQFAKNFMWGTLITGLIAGGIYVYQEKK